MKTYLIIASLLMTSACSSVGIEDYKDNRPKLSINEYFRGELTAHGIIKNRSGEVIRYFNVTMTGSWDENGTGTLAEKFIFDDESIEYRTWTFKPNKSAQGGYSARANDTLSESFIEVDGNAFFMQYDLMINYKGDDIDVQIDDKMYLVNENIMINESIMTKYGIEVGYITLTIIKNTID